MTMPAQVLLDTDILSLIMRKHPAAIQNAGTYLEAHRQFTFSIITRYVILRGLFARGADKQIAAFDRLCSASRVLPLTDPIIVQAATVYADLHQRGELLNDADILIAATALTHGLAVVTNNVAHFNRFRDLQVVNWLT